MQNKHSAKSNIPIIISKQKQWILLLTFSYLLFTITISDCGVIKFLNESEQFNGNLKNITGKFSAPFNKQLTLYGWAKLAPGMIAQNYVLLKFINLSNQTSNVTKQNSKDFSSSKRALQQGAVSGSAYEELIKVSWQGAQDNFLVQYPNGPALSASDVLMVGQAFKSSPAWRFWAVTMDFENKKGKFFFKEFDTLDEKIHDITNITFTDFQINQDFQMILGGDPKDPSLSFTGFMADIGMLTTYYEPLDYIYLLNPVTKSFNSRGNLFATDFSQLKNAQISFRSWGLSSGSSQTISPSLLQKLESLTTESQGVSEFGGSGIQVSSGDSVVVDEVDLSSDSGTVINKLYFKLDFSFDGEFPVDFNIVSYGDSGSANSFAISLVEENSETSVKVFSQDRVNLLPVNQQLSDYVYNSTLKNPRVLKVKVITSNMNVLTFLGKEILNEKERHQIIIGLIQHEPNVLRIYYGNSNKQFSLTQEYSQLPFTLNKSKLGFFTDNNQVTGGKFIMNSFYSTDFFFDFFMSNSFPQDYKNYCYTGTDLYFFLLSSMSLDINKGITNFSSSNSSYLRYSDFCDQANGFVPYQGSCYQSCPSGSFYMETFQICKSCRTPNCDGEILPVEMIINRFDAADSNDNMIHLTSKSSSAVYEIPESTSNPTSNQSPFTSSNLLNLSNIPLSITSDNLIKDIDYKTKINKSEFRNGIYESDVEIELLNPNKKSTFTLEPSMPSAPAGFQYINANRNAASFNRQGIEVDTSGIKECSKQSYYGKILAAIFLTFFFLIVLLFIISNFLFIDNYLKWRLVMTTIGAHLIAFTVMINDQLGRMSLGFSTLIYKVLIG